MFVFMGAALLTLGVIAVFNQKSLQDDKKELTKGFKVFLFILVFPIFWLILFVSVVLFQILSP